MVAAAIAVAVAAAIAVAVAMGHHDAITRRTGG
jgi:hypothetical protein